MNNRFERLQKISPTETRLPLAGTLFSCGTKSNLLTLWSVPEDRMKSVKKMCPHL